MGLDQYAYFVDVKDVIDDFSFNQHYGMDEDFYWRKNRHLQGWMEDLYRRKGGKDEFNCREVRLTKEDLDDLEKTIRKKKFRDAKGFFWGNNQKYEDESKDLEFVKRAKEWVDGGGAVYYGSWW